MTTNEGQVQPEVRGRVFPVRAVVLDEATDIRSLRLRLVIGTWASPDRPGEGTSARAVVGFPAVRAGFGAGGVGRHARILTR